jgi:hypothetical protein
MGFPRPAQKIDASEEVVGTATDRVKVTKEYRFETIKSDQKKEKQR